MAAEVLTGDEILNADDRRPEEVPVPEWSGHKIVLVAAMAGEDRDRLEQEVAVTKGRIIENVRAKVCARSIVDRDLNLVFDDSSIEALGQKNALALDRVFEVARRLSGLGEDVLKDMEKNSEQTPGDASASG